MRPRHVRPQPASVRFLWAVCLCATVSACTATDKNTNKDLPSRAGEGEADDTGTTEDSGPPPEEWEVVAIRPGVYDMTVDSIPENTCEEPLEPGTVAQVPATSDGTNTLLWGYVLLEASNRGRMRGDSTKDFSAPDGSDCVVTEHTVVAGRITSPVEFALDVARTHVGTGTACDAMPRPATCSMKWQGSFVFHEATADTGAPP